MILFIIALFLAFSWKEAVAQDWQTIKIVHPSTTKEWIHFYSDYYKVPETKMIDVAKKESGMRCEGIYGDGGLAYCIYQFHEPTFNDFKEEMGKPWLDYRSEKDQIETAAWAFSKGLGYHWTTY